MCLFPGYAFLKILNYFIFKSLCHSFTLAVYVQFFVYLFNGALNSKELKIFFDGEGNLSIKNTGAINIEKGDTIDLEVQSVSGKVRVG